MYSLYRAWFGGEETYPRLETLSPPDILVRVGNDGEHQFVAHRGVLVAHSGYLKALLATAATSTSTSGHDDISSPVTSVSVSSVGGEAFAPLLNYMYTGRLEVTLDNIYSVLLATHLLHMPGALEQCRAALLRLREPPPPPLPSSTATRPGTVLRPVPNRLVGAPLCWSQPTLYPSGPVGLPHLPNLQLPPSISILPSSGILQEPSVSTVPYSFRDDSVSPPPVALELRRPQHSGIRSVTPEVTMTSCRTKKEEEAINSPEDEDKKETDRTSTVDSVPSPLGSNERTSVTANEQSVNRRSNAENSRSSKDALAATSSGSTGVVFDVACCDGPVRFHRVLNENYASTTTEPTQQLHRACPSEEEVDVTESMENDENGRPEVNSSNEAARDSSSSSGTASYTCGYCQHTFKSQYCYKKHARRHLLPTAETDGTTNANNANINRSDGRRREVRLLDLNVQYYPCKICGSKFPSYYFVHKHRKLCHANADDRSTVGEGNTSSAIVQGTSSSSNL